MIGTCFRKPGRRAGGRRIGLLGGSFNPAHEGHVHISEEALRRLSLDEVWWLVSPQNPLKPAADMAPLQERLAKARRVAAKGTPRIRVTAIEQELGTRYTVDTMTALRRRFPGHRFVWLMGADNLSQLPAWRDWQRILNIVAIAVFARPTYSLKSLAGPVAMRLERYRLAEHEAGRLADQQPPRWVFLRHRLHSASSTAIRHAHKKERARRSGRSGRRRDELQRG